MLATAAQRRRLKAAESKLPFRRPYPQELGDKLRRLEFAEFEAAGAATGELPLIRGFIPFNRLSVPIRGKDCEIICASAFRESLNVGLEVVCTVDHDNTQILGKTSDGTLCLSEDERGLNFAARPPDASYARHAISLMRRGGFAASSFTFHPKGHGAFRAVDRNGHHVAEMVRVCLTEVAIVQKGAYPDARAWLRYAH